MNERFKVKTHLVEDSKLKVLDLEGYRNLKKLKVVAPIKEIPLEIIHCSDLEELVLVDGEFSKFPEGIKQLTSLKILEINNCPKLKHLPKDLFMIKSLVSVVVKDTPIQEIPTEIVTNIKLRYLELINCEIKTIPKELINLKQLGRLWLNRNQLTEIPIFLGDMPKLKAIDLSYNNFTYPPIELCSFKKFPRWFSIPKTYMPENDYKAFAKRFGATKTDAALYLPYLEIARKNKPVVKEMDKNTLLGGLNSKVWKIPNIVLDYLLKWEGFQLKNRPLQAGSSVALLGKVSGKKTDWVKELKAINIGCTTEVTPETTHVLVTVNSKGIEAIDTPWNWAWISEIQLRVYLDTIIPPYLLENSPTGEMPIEKVSQLLRNSDINNVKLGVELLKDGGLTSAIINDLYAIYALEEDKDFRKELKALIKQKASPELLAVLKKNWKPFYITGSVSRSDIYKLIVKFEILEKCPEIDSSPIAYKVCENYEPFSFSDYSSIFWSHILGYSKDSALLTKVIRTHLIKEDNRLYLSEPLMFSCLPNLVELKHLSFTIKKGYKEKLEHFATFPDGMEKLINLEIFYLQYGFLKEIPDFMLEWKKIRELRIYLREDSDWNSLIKLNALSSLEVLSITTDLPSNSIIPKGAHQLTKLKHLRFLGCKKDLILDEIQKALPNCIVENQ
jgi:Leucine-rich repeat (LRR) protein